MSSNGHMLDRELRSFVENHPDGWGHAEWEQLLTELRDRNLDTADETAIGAALERERLLAALERTDVKGVGPKRREAIAEGFGRLWDLEQASAEEVASRAGVPARVAEDLVRAIGG